MTHLSDQPARQPYRFGPIGLLARAPLWQILLLTGVLLVLIALAWGVGRR